MSDPNPFRSAEAEWMAERTLRLASHPAFGQALTHDIHLFGLLYAACAGSVPPPEVLRLERTISATSANEKLLAVMKDLQRQIGVNSTGAFAAMYLEGTGVHSQLSSDPEKLEKGLGEWLKSAKTKVNSRHTSQEDNVQSLAELLGFDELEEDLLLFQLNRALPGFGILFDLLLADEQVSPFLMGVMFDVSASKIHSALHEDATLVRSGLLTVQERPLRIDRVSNHMASTLAEIADTEEEFMGRFVKQLMPASSTSSLARLEDKDREILVKLLRADVPENMGINALVYGPRSIDKKDMLARLFKEEDLRAWVVNTKKVPPEDIPAWTYIAQRWIEEETGGGLGDDILVIDRADQALAARAMSLFSLFGMEDAEAESEDKASDQGLTDSSVPCVWLIDNPKSLSEKNLGRFLFHCEARAGSRADRRSRIQAVIKEFDLPAHIERELSKFQLLGEQPVRQAATLSKIVASDKEHQERVLKRGVLTAQKAIGRDQTEDLRDSVTKYSLENLNVAGRFTPDQIIKALQKNPKGTLAFHGLPGAGKTQLAEYMAVELDKPLIMKRASDLLSKWLGESEQNLAAAFQEAEAEGGLLLLDEMDSFLRDRSMARAEWSVTQVNEILQQMERFDGIFIAATNLMKDIDPAAMRRFTWKLEFLALKPEQAWKMFLTETGYKVKKSKKGQDEAAELRERLNKIEYLTPGDFATVKRQANMLGEDLTVDDWLEQLALETKAKMKGIERNPVGFGAS